MADPVLAVLVVSGCCRDAGLIGRLWRPGWRAGELAAAFAGARLGGGARVVLLPGLECGQGALIAYDLRQVSQSRSGVRPIWRIQPWSMQLTAVSLMLALSRSAAVRRR